MLQDELAATLGVRKADVSKYKARGCPVDDVGKAKAWIAANIKPRAKRKAAGPGCPGEAPQPAADIPPVESPAPDASFTWEARLERARKMEVLIDQAATAAVGRKEYAQLTNLLASYQKALQGISDAEKTALAIRTQSGELVHRDTVRAIFAEILVPLRNAIDLLPMTERSRCNPTAPETAEAALRAWSTGLLLKISQAATKF